MHHFGVCVCVRKCKTCYLWSQPSSLHPKIQLCQASIGRSSHARDPQIDASEGLPASVFILPCLEHIPHMFKSVLADRQYHAALSSGSAILHTSVAFLTCPHRSKLRGLKSWLRMGYLCLLTSLIIHQVLTNISYVQLVLSNGYLRISGARDAACLAGTKSWV